MTRILLYMGEDLSKDKPGQKVKRVVINGGATLRGELDEFAAKIEELKVKYEQFFMGIIHLMPDREHKLLKMTIRRLQKAPFKSTSLAHRLRTLENRYKTYDTYWQRVMRAKEEGTYYKDIFKAELKQRIIEEEKHFQTQAGITEKQMHNLFNSYKGALEKQIGKSVPLDFGIFQKNIAERVQALQEKNNTKKVAFSVVIKDGQVTLRAKVKENTHSQPDGRPNTSVT